jgi:chromate transporter
MIQRIRYLVFLREVAYLSVTCFGGPQSHIAHFQHRLVNQRKYISEDELIELNALCQVLPGPTSTQTLTAIGYKLGGPNLAYLTLLLWMMPSVIIMTAAGILISLFASQNISLEFTKFIQPMAVGFIAFAAYSIGLKTVRTRSGVLIMIVAAVMSFFFPNPFILPLILLSAGALTALKYQAHPKEEKVKMDVPWSNFWLWAGVLIVAAVLGGITQALPIKLFENFYRNGSLVFGGGQVLAPLLYSEFVQYAKPLHHPTSHNEFLTGYAIVQALPGPVFSFSSYLGTLAMRDYGIGGQLLGAFMSAAGIFLPGTFLVFFVIRIWESLKKYRPIRASLEGLNAANTGLVAAAAVLLYQPLDFNILNFSFAFGTFSLLVFTKVPSWLVIALGLLLGVIL